MAARDGGILSQPLGNVHQSRSRSFAYFEAVAMHGSMRKAAATLNVASSALNRQILDLEDRLGVQLFERLPRGPRGPSGRAAVRAPAARRTADQRRGDA